MKALSWIQHEESLITSGPDQFVRIRRLVRILAVCTCQVGGERDMVNCLDCEKRALCILNLILALIIQKTVSDAVYTFFSRQP